MGKKRPEKEAIPYFFKRFFGNDVDGLVEIRVFENGRGKMLHRAWVDNAVEFADCAEAWSERNGNAAVYFGVAVRSRRGGSKDDISHTTALWAEIDTDKLGWDAIETAQYIHDLPGVLQPSCCVHSGHGLHLYWYISPETRTTAATVEAVNKLLRDMVSGDNVFDIARVMRVPYTWNTKSKPVQSRVIWSYHWHRHSIKDVHDAVADFDAVLCGDGFQMRTEWERRIHERVAANSDPDKVYGAAYETRRSTTNARGVKIWEQVVYGGAPGHIGLDEAIMLFTAHEYCRLTRPTQDKIDHIVLETLTRIEGVKARYAPDEEWDWVEEEKEVRKKLMRWVRRWDQIREAQNGREGKAKRASQI